MVLKAKKAERVLKEDRNQNTSCLEKKKEGVKLKPNTLLLSTVVSRQLQCQAQMGCVFC